MAFSRYLLFLLSIVYLSSCDLEKTAKMQSNLPKANGKPGEIIVVKIHSKLFGVTETQISAVVYAYLGMFKVLIIVFNIVPYIALMMID